MIRGTSSQIKPEQRNARSRGDPSGVVIILGGDERLAAAVNVATTQFAPLTMLGRLVVLTWR